MNFDSPETGSNSAMVVLAPLLAIALLLLAAATISPAYVPWTWLAAGLHAHRSDLVVLAFGAAGIALVAFSLQLVGQ